MSKEEKIKAAKKLLKFAKEQNLDSRNDYYGMEIKLGNKKLWLIKPSNFVLNQLSSLQDDKKKSQKMLTGFVNTLLRDLSIEDIIKVQYDLDKILALLPKPVAVEEQFAEEMDFEVIDEDFEEITNFQSEDIDIEIIEEIKPPPPKVVFTPAINPMKRRVYCDEVRILVDDELRTDIKNLMSDDAFKVIEPNLLSVWDSTIIVKAKMNEVVSFEVDDGRSVLEAGFTYETELGIINHLNFKYIMGFCLTDTVMPPMLTRLLFEGCKDSVSSMKPLHLHNKLTAVFDKYKVATIANTHTHLDGKDTVGLFTKYFVENLTEVSNTTFPYRNPNKVRNKRPENEFEALDKALMRLKKLDKNQQIVQKTYNKIIIEDRFMFDDLIASKYPKFDDFQTKRFVGDFKKDLLSVLTELLNDYIECCDKYSYVSYFQSLDQQRKNGKK
ncbi:hypothetical protein MW344_004815 [Vibrio parahaemolyticus]|nr:hypothetical protein [Vibrio parahaemolyticus]